MSDRLAWGGRTWATAQGLAWDGRVCTDSGERAGAPAAGGVREPCPYGPSVEGASLVSRALWELGWGAGLPQSCHCRLLPSLTVWGLK